MAAVEQALDYCLEILRTTDPLRYPATLFLPAVYRRRVACLYAFNAEIAAIPAKVSEPAIGEIRLQWWREAIAGIREAEARANPLALALIDTIEGLSRDGFTPYLDARAADLNRQPISDCSALEERLMQTEGFIFQMAAMICGAKPGGALTDAADHAGIAYGVSEILQPSMNRRPGSEIPAAELAELAQTHLAAAKREIARLPKPINTVFLPLAPAAKIIASGKAKISDLDNPLSPLAIQISLWKAAIFGW